MKQLSNLLTLLTVCLLVSCGGNDPNDPNDPNNQRPEGDDLIAEYIPVTGIEILNKYTAECYIGGSAIIKAQVKPENATNQNVVWSIDNVKTFPSAYKIEIDNSGKLTVGYFGIPRISLTVYAEDNPNAVAHVGVEIKEPENAPIESIKFYEATNSMYVGQTFSLYAMVEPSYSPDAQTLTYTSSNNNIATVDNDGKVTAKNIGEVTITVKTNNGKTATCTINVNSTNPADQQSADLQIDTKYNDQWSTDEKNRANTAKSIKNLTIVEKEIYYYMNLCRMNPKRFAETYAKDYAKNSNYYTTLIEDLNKQSALGTITYNAAMFDLAFCFAKNGGAIGALGHDRTGTGCSSEGKNAECVCWKSTNYGSGLDIVMQFLIDEGVPNLGHRKVFLNANIKSMGASAQKSKLGGQFVVLDFSYNK